MSFEQATGLLKFAVVDTGPGLNPQERSKLFQAFSQADTSITRKFGGTGLGLVISAQLAKKLGGDISLESEPGKGSAFTLAIAVGSIDWVDMTNSLPKSAPVTEVLKVNDIPKLKGRVLVAEDGEDNRGLISFLLKKTGVQFTMVENGLNALEATLHNSFDLILMDVQMPVMDGYTATQAIRQQGSTLPIVALTANSMKSDVERAYAMGCSDFLGKPFTRAEFFTVLNKYLGDSKQPIPRKNPADERTIELIKEDPEILDLILSMIHNLPDRIDEIELASAEADWTKTSMLAHNLRGASGNIGLMLIYEEAGGIEKAAKTGDANLIKSQIERLKHLVDEAQKLDSVLRSTVQCGA